MELDQIIQMLKGKTEIKLVKFISDKAPTAAKIASNITEKFFNLMIPKNRNCLFIQTADVNMSK